MINIDFNDPISIVRSNIGDPKSRVVSDSTISSALSKYEGDQIKASILIMETMLKFFSLQADESRTDDVWYKYSKLYEKYKGLLQEFKNEHASVKRIPILFGGTSISDKNDIANDIDTFTPHLLDDWRTIQEQQKLVEDDRDLWNVFY